MKRSKDFMEGYITALKDYAWTGNRDFVLRVGIKGIPLSDAIEKFERESESEEIVPVDAPVDTPVEKEGELVDAAPENKPDN